MRASHQRYIDNHLQSRRSSLSELARLPSSNRRLDIGHDRGGKLMTISWLGLFQLVLFVIVLLIVFLAGAVNEGRKEMLQSFLTPQILLSMSLKELTEIRVM